MYLLVKAYIIKIYLMDFDSSRVAGFVILSSLLPTVALLKQIEILRTGNMPCPAQR